MILIFIRDMKRNPYAPKDLEYASWVKTDDERLENLRQERIKILAMAKDYLATNGENEDIKKIAKFVIFILDRN